MENQVNLDSEGYIWRKAIDVYGERKPLIIGATYWFNGTPYRYAGDFANIKAVPVIECCYTIQDAIYIRRSIKVRVPEKPVIRRHRSDDNRLIYTDISDDDNQLMVMAKSALRQKEITRSDFKAAYDNDSDMNNSLRCIEGTNSLSWSRFTDIMDRFNIEYSFSMKDKDNNGAPIEICKPKPEKASSKKRR